MLPVLPTQTTETFQREHLHTIFTIMQNQIYTRDMTFAEETVVSTPLLAKENVCYSKKDISYTVAEDVKIITHGEDDKPCVIDVTLTRYSAEEPGYQRHQVGEHYPMYERYGSIDSGFYDHQETTDLDVFVQKEKDNSLLLEEWAIALMSAIRNEDDYQ